MKGLGELQVPSFKPHVVPESCDLTIASITDIIVAILGYPQEMLMNYILFAVPCSQSKRRAELFPGAHMEQVVECHCNVACSRRFCCLSYA